MALRKLILVGCVMALVTVLGISSMYAQSNSRGLKFVQPGLPALGEVPDFELRNQHGESFGLEDMQGKIWVADFIFTTCAGPCPVMSSKMTQLQEAFAGNDRVNFVSISVNPETDTPEVLTKYAGRYNADLDKWHFLTGEHESIHTLAVEGFKVGSTENPVFHSTRFVLVDATGAIRGYYRGTESEDVHRLSHDITELLEDMG